MPSCPADSDIAEIRNGVNTALIFLNRNDVQCPKANGKKMCVITLDALSDGDEDISAMMIPLIIK
ncbi:hypothetical protein GCM10011328_08190 [Hafnia psychrotolerans]|uniref:Uncharacterized protein n=1 Tax=Hafnia psychrotolerans TaxID=1477018 RepID=A0ABQ1G1R5_9GAMM|nr:hypothetical protein GCM10011328_08190 [Hafnia psychrotolerans]